jgi:hypothetical protein
MLAIGRIFCYCLAGAAIGAVLGGLIEVLIGACLRYISGAFSQGALFGGIIGGLTGLLVGDPFGRWGNQ